MRTKLFADGQITGRKRPSLATPLVGNAELRSAYQLNEAKELVACLTLHVIEELK